MGESHSSEYDLLRKTLLWRVHGQSGRHAHNPYIRTLKRQKGLELPKHTKNQHRPVRTAELEKKSEYEKQSVEKQKVEDRAQTESGRSR